MANRTREIVLKCCVTPAELEMINEKMEQLGTTNRGAYLRKMAIDGYIISLDLPELNEMLRQMRYTSNNVNQIAHQANATGIVRNQDLIEMKNSFSALRTELKELLYRLGSIT